MPQATLSSRGRVVIPKAVRERLGLHAGDRVEFALLDTGDVLLSRAAQDVRLLKGCLRPPGNAPVSLARMRRAICDGAVRRS